MNIEIMAVACGVDGGVRRFRSFAWDSLGFPGGDANNPSSRSSEASAKLPIPKAFVARNWRRDPPLLFVVFIGKSVVMIASRLYSSLDLVSRLVQSIYKNSLLLRTCWHRLESAIKS